MVYYLPASEHKMLKSSLWPSSSMSLLPTAGESEFPSFTDFLHSTE
jgi:hypothetical protein